MLKLFDAHFHIIDYKFLVIKNQGYLPPQFLPSDYLKSMETFKLVGGVIVSGSFHEFDTQYLRLALSTFGKNYVGVINYNPDYTDLDIINLNKLGVRAIRFNIRRDKKVINLIEYASKRVFDLVGWHSEIYIDSKDIPNIKDKLLKIPRLVIDHLGLSKEGFTHVLSLDVYLINNNFDPAQSKKILYENALKLYKINF